MEWGRYRVTPVPPLAHKLKKLCNCEQRSRRRLGDYYEAGRVNMFNYPGRKTILCIDDDDGMLGYQKALLERRGYKVLTAASARQGLRIAAVCAVAAVIVDYHMPEMNGHDVATEIKRLTPQVPIIMLSSDEEIPEHALNVVDAFVSKNEAPSRLLPVVLRVCGEDPFGRQETRITA